MCPQSHLSCFMRRKPFGVPPYTKSVIRALNTAQCPLVIAPYACSCLTTYIQSAPYRISTQAYKPSPHHQQKLAKNHHPKHKKQRIVSIVFTGLIQYHRITFLVSRIINFFFTYFKGNTIFMPTPVRQYNINAGRKGGYLKKKGSQKRKHKERNYYD